jgi:hypothetical protein
MKNTVIAGLWLALIIGMPAGAGSGSVRIGFGLFLVVFLASGIAPAISLRVRPETSRWIAEFSEHEAD